MSRALMIATTILEILGLALIVCGVLLAFGLAVGLIVAGVLALGASFWMTRGGGA